MRFFVSSLLFISLLFGASVDYKIKKGKKALRVKSVEYKKMDKQLSKVAKNIFKAKSEQNKLNSKLLILEKNINNNETEYKRLAKKSELLASEVYTVGQFIVEKEQKFIELVSKNFSIALALEELQKPDSESIMMQEVYKIYMLLVPQNDPRFVQLNQYIYALKMTLGIQ
jgi:septal ring factor EnvC (AmiA/AmiB activator)